MEQTNRRINPREKMILKNAQERNTVKHQTNSRQIIFPEDSPQIQSSPDNTSHVPPLPERRTIHILDVYPFPNQEVFPVNITTPPEDMAVPSVNTVVPSVNTAVPSAEESFSPIVVAPISGGFFPDQLAMYRVLCKEGFKPRLIAGSSGGNISSYLCMAANWEVQRIEELVSELDQSYFVSPWYTGYIPGVSTITGYMSGSLYKSSIKSIDLFKKYFLHKSVKDTEIWVAAVNEMTSSCSLFCNMSHEEALIKGENINHTLYKCEVPKYLDGDIHRICKASIASSSVPLMVEAQEIDGQKYVDSGTKFASPLTPLQDEIRSIAIKDGSLHIFYLCGYNLNSDLEFCTLQNMKEHGFRTTEHAVRGLTIHDRANSLSLVQSLSPNKLHFGDVTRDNIPIVYNRLKQSSDKCKYSLFELYPLNKQMLDCTKFNGTDVLKMMEKTDIEMKAHLWWSGDNSLFSDLIQ